MNLRFNLAAASIAALISLPLAVGVRGQQPDQTPTSARPSQSSYAWPAPAVPPQAAKPAGTPNSAAWPRTYTNAAGDSAVLYPPQVDSWTDHSKIRFRAAIIVVPASTGRTEYGVIAAQADTLIDNAARAVLITNMDVAVRFPGLTAEQAAPLNALVKDLLPKMSHLDVSLDQVLAHMKEAPNLPRVKLSYDPPPICFSETPAVMVIYLGEPAFRPVGHGNPLTFAVNTNWVVLKDPATSMIYLLDNDAWLMATDPIKGPWMPATRLPDALSKLPDEGNWSDVKQHVPGKTVAAAPRVIATTQPSELIVTDGPPTYLAIPGTRLMYVSNPTMPLFWDARDRNFYYLAAGRWFRSAELTGPWAAASADLPVEFAKIPSDSPMGFVLASVPNTQEAQDAILLASVPHKATIQLKDAKVNVAYTGTPKFVPIEGTDMTYATNTAYQVIYATGQYYCCYDGVWFESVAATGPWAVCTAVPAVIYTIPPACPVYNCTYVRVYNSTPDTVVVGYTSGYSGEYVAATGALMFGAGMLAGAALASDCWSPCYYSYGCAAHYSYGYGGYYRSASYYGPNGGAGYRAGYNPATGTFYRGGAVAGPGGAHWGGQAYNPWTNTYAQHTGGTNGYKSWGSSYVQQGSNWAEASHQSNWRGSAGWAETSSGKWAEGAHSNVTNSSVAKASNGDYYASHDGNVYKTNGDGTWQKYDGNGSWSDTSHNRSTAQANYDTAKTNWNDSTQKGNWDSQKSSWEGEHTGSSDSWSHHFNESGLNGDAWSRDHGTSNAYSTSDRERGGGESGGGGFRGGEGFGGFHGGGGRGRR